MSKSPPNLTDDIGAWSTINVNIERAVFEAAVRACRGITWGPFVVKGDFTISEDGAGLSDSGGHPCPPEQPVAPQDTCADESFSAEAK